MVSLGFRELNGDGFLHSHHFKTTTEHIDNFSCTKDLLICMEGNDIKPNNEMEQNVSLHNTANFFLNV